MIKAVISVGIAAFLGTIGALWFEKNVKCENFFNQFCTITTGNSITLLKK